MGKLIWIFIVGVAVLSVFHLSCYWRPGLSEDTSVGPFQEKCRNDVGKLAWALAAVLAALAAYRLCSCYKTSPLPVFPLDQYWGPGSPVADDTSIKPFKIEFENEMIKDLKERLAKHRPFTPPLEGIGFEYGFNANYLNKVVEFWKEQYDFKAREKFFNKFPQFTTNIQGLNVHFLHVKPEKVSASVRVLPLLLLRGWPGSIREFYEMIPLLTTTQPGNDFVFEVITPGLPGTGFSEGAAKPGMGPAEISVICLNLMSRLGYDRFIIQGGNWGASVGSVISTIFPSNVIGYHTNLPMVYTTCTTIKWLEGTVFPSQDVNEKYADWMFPLSKYLTFMIEESGSLHIQATKPDAVGVGLNDSPVGLAAYILEKFSTDTNYNNRRAQDGNLTEKFSLTDLIDNLMVYWVSGSITTSMRLYAETLNKRYFNELKLDNIPTEVPTAAISFEYEIPFRPTSFLREKYLNLVQHTIVEHTGHFPAIQSPKVLAEDLFQATHKFLQFSKN